MRQMKASKKLNITVLLVVALFLIVLGIIGVGVGAKYKKTVELNTEVTFTADLAKTITLTEHTVSKKSDGSYTLTDAIEADGKNEYLVLPGVDIPKDPAITITEKSAIPAYLYVEIKESTGFPSTVTYKVTGDWTKLTGVTGKNGGVVYVYKEALTSTPESPIFVLDNNQLVVSEYYAGETFDLTFYGFMAQAVDAQAIDLNKAAEIYNECFMKTTP